VRRLENVIGEKAKLMDRLEPWKHMGIGIQRLASNGASPSPMPNDNLALSTGSRGLRIWIDLTCSTN